MLDIANEKRSIDDISKDELIEEIFRLKHFEIVNAQLENEITDLQKIGHRDYDDYCKLNSKYWALKTKYLALTSKFRPQVKHGKR